MCSIFVNNKKDYWTMAVFSIGIAGGDVLNGWIKNHVKRVRPENHLMETAASALATQWWALFSSVWLLI
ncbi:hypothetical protein ABES21_16290 [Peribacillus frigoritolerans]|uniref:hypothetical protein n=1 Tax=Peribacillus frigoritolerans TaxID=450367 RepID=UPI001921CA51